ncbi:MAG TPA: HlyD family efflux transporter periplasmic adaptor subunit [Pseudomonadales bacterium]
MAIVVIGYLTTHDAGTVPAGLAKANGRIEVERIDVGAKYSGRVAEILVKEGDYVEKDSVVARLDRTELNAEQSAARANVVRAEEAIRKAEAEVALREAEHKLFEIELERAMTLTQRAVLSEAELDKRNAEHAVSEARILAAKAALGDATAALAVAQARVTQLDATIAEMTLKAPVAGRVEYKLVQPGTILAAGARVVSILDLSDAYMTIFLPTSQSGRVALGSDARIVLDAAPTTIIPAMVSFVAGEAQFTPKVVETANEREKLMYRVKLKIDPQLLDDYRAYVKPGLTGDAYVKISRDAQWPDSLSPSLPDAN